MYNPRIVGSGTNEYESVTVTSGAAIAKNDFVTLKTDGQAEPTAAGNPIFGIAMEAASGSGVVINVYRAFKGMLVMMDADQVGTTLTSAHVGGRVDTVGSTGAQLVDSSTIAQVGDGTDTGQLLIKAVNPQGFGFDSDTSITLCEIAEVE